MSTTPQADDHRTPAAETPRQSAESARENPCTEPSGGETSAPFTCYVVRIISAWQRVGEVHHVLKRSTHPEERLNPANGILLSKEEHALAETACPGDPTHQLLDIIGPADLSEKQTFTWRDVKGAVIRTRIG